jgi:hypothetical protein
VLVQPATNKYGRRSSQFGIGFQGTARHDAHVLGTPDFGSQNDLMEYRERYQRV